MEVVDPKIKDILCNTTCAGDDTRLAPEVCGTGAAYDCETYDELHNVVHDLLCKIALEHPEKHFITETITDAYCDSTIHKNSIKAKFI